MNFYIRLGNFYFWIGNEPEQNQEESYISKAIKGAIFLGFILPFIPNSISPFSFFQFWKISNSNLLDWWTIGKPLFAWGSGLSVTLLMINHYFNRLVIFPKQPKLKLNQIISLIFAIIFFASLEEICFRWLIFLSNIIFIKAINFLFFGWLGLGIWEVVHNFFFAPIANWITWGYLETYLLNRDIWFVGASIIMTNTLFRDGHLYQGCLGWINSWFIGIFCFWVTLNYGLLAAMFTHSIYNIIVIFTSYLWFNFFHISNPRNL